MTTSKSSDCDGLSMHDGAQLRIACVYRREHNANPSLCDMAWIRLFRMSQALARRGHQVDILLNRYPDARPLAPNLRQIPFYLARWDRYQIVKTFFHRGFDSLVAEGAGDHPFIISKLGSVVGREPTDGVHFHGAVREQLFATQGLIAARSKIVTVLTDQSAALWRREHGSAATLYRVPTGVDADIPAPGRNPYVSLGINRPVALFAGNLYTREHQPEVNLLWQERLNQLGRALARRGISLVAMGTGETDHLDPSAVLHVGTREVDEFWDWQRFAKVGIVLAQGPVQDNESSKIYYYLRTALPVICEASVPNRSLIEETGCGAITPYGDIGAMADAAADLIDAPPHQGGVSEYMIRHHSWDARAALYGPALRDAARSASAK